MGFLCERKLCNDTDLSFPHIIQLVTIGRAIFDVRFLGVGGVDTANRAGHSSPFSDHFSLQRWNAGAMMYRLGRRAAAMLMLTAAFQWSAARQHRSPSVFKKLRRGLSVRMLRHEVDCGTVMPMYRFHTRLDKMMNTNFAMESLRPAALWRRIRITQDKSKIKRQKGLTQR